MTDPRKCQLAQSICIGNDSLDLILPYILNLFANPKTCVNSFLHLFNKLAKFISRSELQKRFLPIIIHALNVVDLNETVGIDLSKDDDTKLKFCKLFDYVFMNELRIIFGLNIFLTQISPFLIEAISGFKDFEYELPAADSVSITKRSNSDITAVISGDSKSKAVIKKKLQTSDVLFDMENAASGDLKVIREDDLEIQNENVFCSKSLNMSSETLEASSSSASNATRTASLSSGVGLVGGGRFAVTKNNDEAEVNPMFECDRVSLNSMNASNAPGSRQVNISNTAFNTFVKIIQTLGPVLTCKYCCSDLFKMLAICYMNNKCLSSIENTG